MNSIPTPNEFKSIFGCSCTLDEDFTQKCIFNDKKGSILKLTFGLADMSFGLSLLKGDSEVLKIYDEFLIDVKVYKDEFIEVILGNDDTQVLSVLSVWPEISISITKLKTK